MLNQSFTVDNFRRIVDYENRRGVYLEAEFFPEIAKLTQRIKKCTTNMRDLQRKKTLLPPDQYRSQQSTLNEEKQGLKKEKEKHLTLELQKISAEIGDKNFKVILRQVTIPSGKKAYGVGPDASTYFAIKQLQDNLRRIYRVKQSSRYEIICQLSKVLDDSFPKYVIRTDIDNFYESISREKLLKVLDTDAFLTFPSRRILRQVLEDYGSQSGSPTGVPRGVGISAYLSELYMREFDEGIKAHDDIIFYARYVDDIVIVFSPEPNSSVTGLRPFVEKQANAVGLTLNNTKTRILDCRIPARCEFQYLGYKFSFGRGPITIGLSDNRKQKYKKRISRAFDVYKKRAQFEERKARRLLVRRIQFLTGNTRLKNNKANIMVGVFYSNSCLSDSNELTSLDDHLKVQIAAITPASLQKTLLQYSFKDGFSQRTFRSFSSNELSRIVEVWKHGA